MSVTPETQDQPTQGQATRPRANWQVPVVRVVGDLRDLVLGGGKNGSVFDMDPTSTTKKGTG